MAEYIKELYASTEFRFQDPHKNPDVAACAHNPQHLHTHGADTDAFKESRHSYLLGSITKYITFFNLP